MSERGYPERTRARFDAACNDPDNGLFAHKMPEYQLATWDGELLEFEANGHVPRFTELDGAVRLYRRNWPILASKDWYGNWCWNAYWLAPDTLMDLLAHIHRQDAFRCCVAPSQLFEDWNDRAVLDRTLWLANLVGPPERRRTGNALV